MKTIYKYSLSMSGLQRILMPKGAMVLSAKEQDGKLCIWVLADPENEQECRYVAVVGTGNPIREFSPDLFVFVDTVVMGDLVWHIFAQP